MSDPERCERCERGDEFFKLDRQVASLSELAAGLERERNALNEELRWIDFIHSRRADKRIEESRRWFSVRNKALRQELISAKKEIQKKNRWLLVVIHLANLGLFHAQQGYLDILAEAHYAAAE